MKHIYIFNEECRASKYGIGTYITLMIECLSKTSNVILNIVSLYSNQTEYEVKKTDTYTIHYIPGIPNNRANNRERYYISAFYLLISNLSFNQYDDVIFHLNYHNELYLIKKMREKCPKCFIYYTIHYQEWCFKLKGNLSRLKNIINGLEKNEEILSLYNNDKDIYENVDKVICLSKYTEDILMNIYKIEKKKINTIYNGLDFHNKKTNNFTLRKKMFFSNDDKIILFVGRLDEIKGLEVLIEAFKIVLDFIPNAHLLIVGDGDFEKYHSQSFGYWKKITFTGRLDKKYLYEIYQIADVGVMPSFHEQCSFVAIEMMAFKIPLIVSDTTGLKEMQSNDKMIINTNVENKNVSINPKELAKKIISVLSGNKNDYVNKCINHYKIEVISQLINSLYV